MPDHVRIVIIAIGGYGANYVRGLLENTDPAVFSLEGVVDPFADGSAWLPRLTELGVPRYDLPEEFYAQHEADLALISSPIHYHCPHTCAALAHGSHVLCEKPIAGTIQEARRMIQARDAAGRFVSIGYNWSFSPEIQALKADIMAGRFGQPVRLKCLGLGARDAAYYGRNDWAGAARSASGDWILDSPANNAFSHYLHNMFYLLGETVDRSAQPVDVVAELYRANDITNFDTGVVRAHTDAGAEVLFYTSHAVPGGGGVRFLFEFEEGTVAWDGGSHDIRARTADGAEKTYPVDQSWERMMCKLWDALDSVRTGAAPVCGLEAASAQTLCINGMHDSVPEVVEFPPDLVRVSGQGEKRVVWVEGLAEALDASYEAWKLPSEMGLPWAEAGEVVQLSGYADFPGGGR